MGFIKKSLEKIWEGFLQNIGVLVTAFIISGGYLFAINMLKEFQSAVRAIPSDYFLTPLVLILILLIVLLKINRAQKRQLSKLQQEPEKDEDDARLVTHLGVWWKIYPKTEHIEDFPYCACCDSRVKLVQKEWYPDELFKCPKTGTEYKLYDDIPRKKEQVLRSLYEAYFHGFPARFRKAYFSELRKLKELKPDMAESELTMELFKMKPLSLIPTEEQQAIIGKNPNPMSAFHFIESHFDSYKKYFKKKNDEGKQEKSPNKAIGQHGK
jgi:hypothetical protein